MHVVAVVAMNNVIAFDLATPYQIFSTAKDAKGRALYKVLVCATAKTVHTDGFAMRIHHGLAALHRADTVIVPGISNITMAPSSALTAAIQASARRGARIASICTGAFVLAAAGLLAGQRATTHWQAADELQRRYPDIEVDPNVLYVDAGRVLTSAGAAAGLDLCLYMVRRDHGSAIAADAARAAVMPLERQGSQAQFIKHAQAESDRTVMEPLLRWMEAHLHEPLPLEAIAKRAAMSVRSLSRNFREQVGTTPHQWLLHARIRRAQNLLETTAYGVELVAERCGFHSVTAFREQFSRIVSVGPQAYQSAFHTQERRRG